MPDSNPSDRLITVAIHTPSKAQELKLLLESEGVEGVSLQNVNLDQPVVSAGVRVRIPETELPLALRIIENREMFAPDNSNHNEASAKPSASSRRKFVLVPVDFSDGSLNAAKAAFRIAANHGAEIELLHSYLTPYPMRSFPMSKSRTFDFNNTEDTRRIIEQVHTGMNEFASRLRSAVKSGEIPGVKFSTTFTEGVPEDAILSYVKEHCPWLIVMATRSAAVKGTELTGSVSAEVMDSCRVQALTVPAHMTFSCFHDVRHIVMLSTLEPEDFLAIDAAYRLVDQSAKMRISIVCLPSPKYSDANVRTAIDSLREYVVKQYPDLEVNISTTSRSTLIEDYSSISRELNANLLVVPNKKKHLLARLFNPGMAHRVLFHFDVPMLVAPV